MLRYSLKKQLITFVQCWGELLLKVMRYNVALLPKKVTDYVCVVLGRVTFKSNALQCCVTP